VRDSMSPYRLCNSDLCKPRGKGFWRPPCLAAPSGKTFCEVRLF